jgi:hypothetical protein
MMRSRPITASGLSALIAILAAVASAVGLLAGGVYRDNAFVAAGWHGNDLVTLVAVVPALAASLILSGRGSHRARLVGLGLLAYMLYNYAFYLFGAAFNRLFLLYVLLVTLSGLAIGLALVHLDVDTSDLSIVVPLLIVSAVWV